MRLYCPAGELFRMCNKDYKIPNHDYVIEKGICLIIPLYGIHHDSRYYYDPYLFNPERFSPEESNKRPNMAYLPFGIK